MKKIPSGIPLIISLPFLTSASAELKQEYMLDDGQGLRSLHSHLPRLLRLLGTELEKAIF